MIKKFKDFLFESQHRTFTIKEDEKLIFSNMWLWLDQIDDLPTIAYLLMWSYIHDETVNGGNEAFFVNTHEHIEIAGHEIDNPGSDREFGTCDISLKNPHGSLELEISGTYVTKVEGDDVQLYSIDYESMYLSRYYINDKSRNTGEDIKSNYGNNPNIMGQLGEIVMFQTVVGVDAFEDKNMPIPDKEEFETLKPYSSMERRRIASKIENLINSEDFQDYLMKLGESGKVKWGELEPLMVDDRYSERRDMERAGF